MSRDSSVISARTAVVCVGIFVAVTAVTWVVLNRTVPFTYVSRGVVEIGYFNPRDYLPHPVVSTRGIAAVVGDAAFASEVARAIQRPGTSIGLRAAPLEEGLVRVEARAEEPEAAHRAAVVACSLVVARANEGFLRERDMVSRQIEAIRRGRAMAESLAQAGPVMADAKAIALRAAAHFTEVQVKTETEAELMAQKKETRLLVRPQPASAERPALGVVAMGPGAVTAAVAAALYAALRRRRETPR